MKLETEFQDEDFRKGEVADVSIATIPDGRIVARAKAKSGGEHTFYYDCIEALYNDWSDCEEPKEYWFINELGNVEKAPSDWLCDERASRESIGNYFETREEAEKAVEHLRAWKRLKDTYFIRFDLDFVKSTINFTYRIDGTLHSSVDEERIIFEDIKTIFGGEE